MSRVLPAGLGVALTAAEVAPVFLVELDWPDGTVYAWNGYHTIPWSGHDWVGTGHLGGISELKESSDGNANGVQLILSGIPTANIQEALRNDSQGCSARIYFGVISQDGFVIDPYLIFDGFIDFASIVEEGPTSTVTVNLEKEMIDGRSSAERWNHETQLLSYSTDLAFEYLAALVGKTFSWGKVPTLGSGGGNNGNGDMEPGGDQYLP